jgi:hypothetical protein
MTVNKPLPSREAIVRRIELNSARNDLSPLGELLIAIARAANASIVATAQAARQWRAIN